MVHYFCDIKINGIPSLANKNVHWRVTQRERSKWHQIVLASFINKKPIRPLKKCVMTLIRATADKCDYDNLVYSFKPVVDGLVHAKILVDDDMDTIIKRDYFFQKFHARKHTLKLLLTRLLMMTFNEFLFDCGMMIIFAICMTIGVGIGIVLITVGRDMFKH